MAKGKTLGKKSIFGKFLNERHDKTSFLIILSITLIILIVVGFFGLGFLTKNKNTLRVETRPTVEPQNAKVESGLPNKFPKDFPIYPGATPTSSWSSEGDKSIGISIVWETKDKLDAVVDFYKQELASKGWKVLKQFDSQNSSTLTIAKGTTNGFIGLSMSDTKTTISVTVGVDK